MAPEHDQAELQAPGSLRIALPDGFTAKDAEHLARLLTTLGEGRWRCLEATFGRLAEPGVGPWPGPPGEALLSVAVELRRWRARRLPVSRANVRPGRL
jgi:hypothetical protein